MWCYSIKVIGNLVLYKDGMCIKIYQYEVLIFASKQIKILQQFLAHIYLWIDLLSFHILKFVLHILHLVYKIFTCQEFTTQLSILTCLTLVRQSMHFSVVYKAFIPDMIIKFSRKIHIGYEEGIEPLVPTVFHGFQCPQCFFLQLQDRGMSPFSDIEICFSRQGITQQHMCIVRK